MPLHRRDFLKISGLSVLATSIGGAHAFAASDLDPAAFQALSSVVVGDVAANKTLSDAVFQAFTSVQPDILPKLSALKTAIDTASLKTPKDFSASDIVKNADSKATAMALTSAWYLGHVGATADKSVVFAFEDAAMFRPTIDVMVIPSYARGGPDYWLPNKDGSAPART